MARRAHTGPEPAILLAKLVQELGGTCDWGPLGGEESGPAIADVHLDSRFVGAGDLFAALPGRVADGARFVPDALARGAVAVLSPAQLSTDVLRYGDAAHGGRGPANRPSASAQAPNWVHPRARRVAGEAAARVHDDPSRSMFVAAVTGTNGKTTTTHLIGRMLEIAGRSPAVIGTTGYRLAGGQSLPATHTTPDAPTLQRLLRRHLSAGGDSAAIELSSHALDQERHAGLDVDCAVFTNLTRDHLDYHADMQAYAASKEPLFAGLKPDSHAVVNADDPVSDRMALAAERCGAHVHRFSTRSRVDLFASKLESDSSGTHFFLQGMGISGTRIHVPMAGRFNVENALAATAVVLLSGASPSSALEGLASASPAPGRLERVPTGEHGFTCLVDYAHSEDALRNVLGSLRPLVGGSARLICVFGCGGDRDPGKRAPMGAAAGELADVCVVTSDNPRGEDPAAIAAEVLRGLEGDPQRRASVHVELDRRRAIAWALAEARPGDVVLLAGKGHETTQTIGSRVLPFDDRSVAAELLAGRGHGA